MLGFLLLSMWTMNRFNSRLMALLLAGAMLPSLSAAEEPPTQEKTYSPPPWRLIETWWDIGRDWPFESYSVEVTINENVPSNVNLSIAPIGLGYLNKTPFRGEITMNVCFHDKISPQPRPLGPGLIFSLRGARGRDAIRPSLGEFCQNLPHEGDSASVRRPYAWTKGKYTYKVVRKDREDVDGVPYTWVGAIVDSHETHENVFVGALRFPGERLVLSRQSASFVEIDGFPRPAGEIPRVVVSFGDLRVNGIPIEKPTALAEYPEGVPDYAEARAAGNCVVITMGKLVKDRTQRRVDLLTNSLKPESWKAKKPKSEVLIGKFDILATYVYARALRAGMTEDEAKQRGNMAAIMGARAGGGSQGGPRSREDSPSSKETGEKKKTPTITAEMFNHQVADKMGEFFDELFLPSMKKLVENHLSYEKIKQLLEIPVARGAKISGDQFEKRTSEYLKKTTRPKGVSSAE
jgi:hypothetical protein